MNAAALAADLRARLRVEVRFDPGSRALMATGGSNYRQVPLGVVVPADVDDVVAAVATCREHDAPVLPLGAHTSLAGQAINVAVVLDFSKYLNRILAIDSDWGLARVEPGLILDDFLVAAERHQRTFGPDPSTHAYCTLGGMIGNNSCGMHSVMAGNTVDNVEELEVLTYEAGGSKSAPRPRTRWRRQSPAEDGGDSSMRTCATCATAMRISYAPGTRRSRGASQATTWTSSFLRMDFRLPAPSWGRKAPA